MRRAVRPLLLALLAFAASVVACEPPPPVAPPPPQPPPGVSATPEPPPAPMNPFLTASPLQYQAPPFDRIHDADYEPAIEAGMAAQLGEVQRITSQEAAPTFENTIVAMEKSGELLTRVSKVFSAMAGSNTNETIQKVEERTAPKLAAHQDAIFLDAKLFARIQALYDQRGAMDAESRFLTERYHRDFVHAGAKLSPADKEKLSAINREESTLTTQFTQRILAANKAGALVVDREADLRGMSAGDVAAAAELGTARGLAGKWVVALQNTTQQPAQVTLADRATRERLFKASTQRAEHGDGNDTRALVQRLAELRAAKAKLLGQPTWAAHVLEDQMAEKPESAVKLLTDMAPAAVAKARAEAKRMQELASREKGGPKKLEPWDWQFYAEQVRKADFALEDAQIKPYFEIGRVLTDGVFFAANKLYGLTFVERKDLPVYHPDVRVFEVFDPQGKSFALFYADYFKRDNKNGGAWMDTFVDQSGLLGTHPVVFNVCNFTKPAPGQPALISFSDVTTMFHEFGHGLHGLLSNVKYPTLAGTATPRDFVEFPSQFNEHWASEPTVFANYAKHFQTGAAMPADLAKKLERSSAHGQGFGFTEYLEAALLDLAWHSLPAGPPPADVGAFESDALKRFKVDFALVPPRYRTSYFMHVWGGGYSAGYYAYLWSEVLAHDAYAWFVENGGMTRQNGDKFREMILSRGHTQEMAAMYRAFRGRDPSVEPLLEFRGMVTHKAAAPKKAAKR
jgi:peptidyl-dipeptidase Dcp